MATKREPEKLQIKKLLLANAKLRKTNQLLRKSKRDLAGDVCDLEEQVSNLEQALRERVSFGDGADKVRQARLRTFRLIRTFDQVKLILTTAIDAERKEWAAEAAAEKQQNGR